MTNFSLRIYTYNRGPVYVNSMLVAVASLHCPVRIDSQIVIDGGFIFTTDSEGRAIESLRDQSYNY